MRPRHFVAVALALIVTIGAVAAAEANAASVRDLESLAWLAGSWEGIVGGKRAEEHWTEPRGGMMLGVHRDTPESGSAFFEYLRIEESEDGLIYQASPMGRPPTPFRLVESGPRRAVFENPEHDFPQRILYWLDEEGKLRGRIEGEVDGETRGSEWVWEPSALTAE